MRRAIGVPAAFLAILALALWVREERVPETPVKRRPEAPGPEVEPEPAVAVPPSRRWTPGQAPEVRPGPPGPAASAPAIPELPWRPGYMGLNGQDNPAGGALVTQVFPQTAAWQTGIRVGDILLEFNGRSVPNLETLFQWARNTGEGAPVSLRIRRGGSELYLGLQLGRHPLYN